MELGGAGTGCARAGGGGLWLGEVVRRCRTAEWRLAVAPPSNAAAGSSGAGRGCERRCWLADGLGADFWLDLEPGCDGGGAEVWWSAVLSARRQTAGSLVSWSSHRSATRLLLFRVVLRLRCEVGWPRE